MNNFEQLKKMIMDSDLELADKVELIEVLSFAKDEDLAPFLELLNEDPKMLPKMSDNYKAKRSAVGSENSEVWDKMVKAEESELEEMDSE